MIKALNGVVVKIGVEEIEWPEGINLPIGFVSTANGFEIDIRIILLRRINLISR